MDYTKLPKSLIYKDRKDIDDFPVTESFDFPTMEETYLNALEKRPFITEAVNAPELILRIFNNARYITTLISMERHPNHYLRKYLEKAGCNERNVTIVNHVVPATMALVSNYLFHYFQIYRGSKILSAIKEHFNTVAWAEYSLGGQDDFNKLVITQSSGHPIWVTDKDFEPRDIKEALADLYVTAKDIVDNIDYIFDFMDKKYEDEDEKIPILYSMYKKVEAWFPKDDDDKVHRELALGKIDTLKNELDPRHGYEFYQVMDKMEESLFAGKKISPETENDMNALLKKVVGLDMNEIKELEEAAENEDDGIVEESNDTAINEEVETLKKRVCELEEQNKMLKEELENYNERGRKGINQHMAAIFGIKLAELLGISYTNKKHLAPMLSKLFGWGKRKLEQELCKYMSDEDEMKLANIFGELSPDVAKKICCKWDGNKSSENVRAEE